MTAPFSLANLVHQSATTTGTGNFTLAAISGKQTFDTAYGHGATTDVFEYFISSQAQAEWEHGTGHMSDATTLVRDTIWDGSNAGAAVSFSAGTKDVTSAIGALTLWTPRGYIDGLTLSNDGGTPTTKLDVAAGICRDDTDAMTVRLTASKVIDCTTTGANGLDTGALEAATWYHVFAIGKRDGSAQAALASTSPTAPTLPTGYQYQRRIGAFKTDGSSHILAFSQVGDEFLWIAPTVDFNNQSQGTGVVLRTLNVATGVKVTAIGVPSFVGTVAANYIAFFSPDATGDGTSLTEDLACQVANVLVAAGVFRIRTDTSARINTQASAAAQHFGWATRGWIDQRGKNA